ETREGLEHTWLRYCCRTACRKAKEWAGLSYDSRGSDRSWVERELSRHTGKSFLCTPETVMDHSSLDEEKQDWAFEKLEARGLIERLVDGQIVRTEAGQLLAKAVSGALQLGHPVTPAIVRLLAAMRQVGTLYVKERKVRM